eukprot:g5391.t1
MGRKKKKKTIKLAKEEKNGKIKQNDQVEAKEKNGQDEPNGRNGKESKSLIRRASINRELLKDLEIKSIDDEVSILMERLEAQKSVLLDDDEAMVTIVKIFAKEFTKEEGAQNFVYVAPPEVENLFKPVKEFLISELTGQNETEALQAIDMAIKFCIEGYKKTLIKNFVTAKGGIRQMRPSFKDLIHKHKLDSLFLEQECNDLCSGDMSRFNADSYVFH